MINRNMFSSRIVLLFLAYLMLFFISVHLYYEHNGMFRRGFFGVLYTAWGIWFYSLYFLPIIITGFVIIKQYPPEVLQKGGYFSAVLVLILGTHVIYWSIVSGFKYYVYNTKNTNNSAIEEQLNKIQIIEPVLSYESASERQNSSYKINIKITNPLSYDVEIKLSVPKRDSITRYSSFYNLLKSDVKARMTESYSVNINIDTMAEIVKDYNEFSIKYSLAERSSSTRINHLIDLTHELCKWSILTCPNFDNIKYNNSTYPFDDDELHQYTGSTPIFGTLASYSRVEITELIK